MADDQSQMMRALYDQHGDALLAYAMSLKLHALVCAGTLSLTAAQHAIATNWWDAYRTYLGIVSRSTDLARKARQRSGRSRSGFVHGARRQG